MDSLHENDFYLKENATVEPALSVSQYFAQTQPVAQPVAELPVQYQPTGLGMGMKFGSVNQPVAQPVAQSQSIGLGSNMGCSWFPPKVQHYTFNPQTGYKPVQCDEHSKSSISTPDKKIIINSLYD